MHEDSSTKMGPESGRLFTVEDIGDPERFWSKVEKAGPLECWEWLASRRDGRAIYSLRHKPYFAARVAYVLSGWALHPGMLVCHTCDNAGCVNPVHLYQGTSSSNMRDMDRRGRRTTPRGAKHPNAKFTTEQVIEIRRRLSSGELRADLAREYGVSWPVMDDIDKGRRYKDAMPC